jgi:hypothetical protein
MTWAIYHDPLFTGTQAAWALIVSSSNDILIYGMISSSFYFREADTYTSFRCWILQLLPGDSHNFFCSLLTLFLTMCFQNYVQTCLTTLSCQTEIVDIDCTSSVNIYSMSTVGTTYQLSVNGTPVIAASDNLNGFAQTVTVWTSESSTFL